MTEKSISQEEILFEKEPEIRKTEKPSDFLVQETSHKKLLAENARTKSSMAKELSQMGFSKKSIECILHLKMDMEEVHENEKGG